MQERITDSKTLKGRYFDLVGHFFSIYCVYKIFIVSRIACFALLFIISVCMQCTVNIIFDRVGKVGEYTSP